jgi:uncharacterized protein (DUF2141 family)
MLRFISDRPRQSEHAAPKATPATSSRRCSMESLESRLLFTVLTFDNAATQWANYTPLPQTYGDRVTAATQNGFKYGTAGGTTPNVLAGYGTAGTKPETAATWNTGYGNLTNVIFPNPNGTKFQMTLTADTGFKAALGSFDMAAYGAASYTINNVKVTDGSGKVLFNQNSVVIKGSTSHTHFTMSSTVAAPKLIISYDSTNSGGFDVGMDNVQFSQAKIQLGSVSGTVFNDVNGNGKKDATTDKGLAGWRVYVDANNNGMYDSGETFVTTDANGNFSFKNLAAGTYIFSVQLKRGYYQTAPHALVYTVTITSQTVTGDLFGVKAISPP